MVEAPSGTQQVKGTSVVLTGYADDTAVQVKVHAVNEAGDGPDATATGRTIGVPTLTLTGETPDYNSIAVTFTPNNKGGAATCLLSVSGSATAAQVGCTTQPVTLTMAGLVPNKSVHLHGAHQLAGRRRRRGRHDEHQHAARHRGLR